MTKFLPVLGLALVACGSNGGEEGSDADFTAAADAVTGIYSVGDYTLNEAACAPGGTSQRPNNHAFAVAWRVSFFGVNVLNIMSCASPEECRDIVAGETGGSIDFLFGVEKVGDNGELLGGGGSTGFSQQDGTCTEGSVFDTVLTLTGDQLRIETGITVADDYAQDSEGFCTTDLARDAAAGNTCSEMEVLTATFLEPL